MRFTLRGRAGQAGFTLVELMVTLLILGILVGIVVMTMSVSRSKAQQAACKANLRTLYMTRRFMTRRIPPRWTRW
jgi:prepilin-type N-terminal cleavage/methylation domain-containing protein